MCGSPNDQRRVLRYRLIETGREAVDHNAAVAGMDARITVEPFSGGPGKSFEIRFLASGAEAAAPVECALGRILEARIPLDSAGVPPGGGVRFQFSLWQGGLPMEAVPQQGWLSIPTTDPDEVGR